MYIIGPFSQCSIQDIVEHLSDIIGHPRLHPDECLRNDDYSGFSICEYYNVEKYQCETPCMIPKKSLDSVLDQSIILTKTAPNDNAKSISVQCGWGQFLQSFCRSTSEYVIAERKKNPDIFPISII